MIFYGGKWNFCLSVCRWNDRAWKIWWAESTWSSWNLNIDSFGTQKDKKQHIFWFSIWWKDYRNYRNINETLWIIMLLYMRYANYASCIQSGQCQTDIEGSTRHLKSFFEKCLQCLPTRAARQLAPWRCNLIEGTLPSIGTTWKDSWTGWEGGSSSLWRVFTMPTCHTCRLDMSFRLSSTSVVHLPVTLFRR